MYWGDYNTDLSKPQIGIIWNGFEPTWDEVM